jgi:hypothetical protein
MKEIQLTKGCVAKVDDEDYEYLMQWKWQAGSKKRYAQRARIINGKVSSTMMHRVIMNITDTKVHIDHKDGDGLNNQKSNLRPCTRNQNQANRKKSKSGVSKYLGGRLE